MFKSMILMIVVMVPSLLLAQPAGDRTLAYGDWSVILSSDGIDLIATTMQDEDKYLGYRCFTKTGKCVHTIVPATRCEDGAQYPILVNASNGSLMVETVCSKHDDMHELLPTDWDGFHRIITESRGYIGFAIPLESGQFKVIRFSLRGAKDAIIAAETAIRRKDSSEYH